jgi:hypothetical protein
MVRPCAPYRYSPPHSFSCLGFSRRQPVAGHTTTGCPPPQGDRFPRSTQEPRPRSRRLYAGHHLANQQAPARLIPGPRTHPGFDVTHTVTTLHQRFTRVRLRDPHLTRSYARLFPRRSQPRLLTAAARGGLRPSPAKRPRRPNSTRLLHLSCSIASVRFALHRSSFCVRGTPPSRYLREAPCSR